MTDTASPKGAKPSPIRVDALIPHAVHALGGESTRNDIYRHLRGRLRWKEEAAQVAVDSCIAQRTLVVDDAEDGDWLRVGPAFDPDAFPHERDVASRVVSRVERIPHADRTQSRRAAILAALSARVARTTDSLWKDLEGTFGYRRKLERDLADLKKAGLIRRDADGWRDARDHGVLSENATYAALRLLMDLVDDVIPGELQKSITQQLEKARKRLESLPSNDPAARWLRAFRIVPPRHRLGDPIIDPDVRDTIEEAILTNCKVRLQWPDTRHEQRGGQVELHSVEYVAEHVCSISHFLIEVPANPSIEVWYDGWTGGLYPRRLALNEILSAELTMEAASYPLDHEPELHPGLISILGPDANEHDGRSLLTLAMTRETYASLQNTRIGRQLAVIDEEQDDQLIVGMRYHLDVAVLRYLEQLPGVTVLGPKNFRGLAALPARRKYSEYRRTEAIAGSLGISEDEVSEAFHQDVAARFGHLIFADARASDGDHPD